MPDGLYGLQYSKSQILQVNHTCWMHFDGMVIVFIWPRVSFTSVEILHEVCWAAQEIRVGETLEWLRSQSNCITKTCTLPDGPSHQKTGNRTSNNSDITACET
jgi:hypothetical protein